MDKSTALRLLHESAPELRRRYGVASAVLFGSLARGDSDAASDIDVAVRSTDERADDVMALCGVSGFLAGVFGRDVDVVALPARDPALSATIEQDLLPAFEGD